MNCTKNAMLPITLDKEAREHLAQFEEITVDLPSQTVSSSEQTFEFKIDETWKNKLVNGLDDIAITLQYEDLIENMKNILRVLNIMTVKTTVSTQDIDEAFYASKIS